MVIKHTVRMIFTLRPWCDKATTTDGLNWSDGTLLSSWERVGLRIHEETEKGDNETIKKGTGVAPVGNSCCGGGPELADR